jgi:hypothetical protein
LDDTLDKASEDDPGDEEDGVKEYRKSGPSSHSSSVCWTKPCISFLYPLAAAHSILSTSTDGSQLSPKFDIAFKFPLRHP